MAGVEGYQETDKAMYNKALKDVGFDLNTYERQNKKHYAEINKYRDYLKKEKFFVDLSTSSTNFKTSRPNYATEAAILKKIFLDLNLKMSDDQFKLF